MSIKSRLIFLYIIFMCKIMALVTVVDIGVLPLIENSVGITFYIDIINEDRENICDIFSQCRKCCLVDSSKEDCDITVAFGDDVQNIKPRDRKTLLYVVPLVFQHDLVGYCNFLLIYQYNNTREEIDVTIPFNTKVGVKKSKELMNHYIGIKKVKHCTSLDEDSLNDCKPVMCNMKYLDKRPVYDYILKKCVEAPICLTSLDKELPDYVYVPNSNTCRNLDLPLTVQDIYVISTGLGTVTESPDQPPVTQVKIMTNCSTISQNINLLRDLMHGKMCPIDNEIYLDYSECFKSALLTIVVCIVSICGFLFILVCCVNYTAWVYILWSDGKLSGIWKVCKNPYKGRKCKKTKNDRINSTIRNALLREVIVRDIPLELRNSVIDVCDRMAREVERKKRYRGADVGSQISLQKNKESPSSSMSSGTSLENNIE